jgi:DNA-binding NarL/FixJ family response regulator
LIAADIPHLSGLKRAATGWGMQNCRSTSMYVLTSANTPDGGRLSGRRDDPSEEGDSPEEGAPDDPAANGGSPQTLIYLDPRAFTRDCVGRWLQSSLSEFQVCLVPDPEQLEAVAHGRDRVRAVVVNTGTERMASAAVAHSLARVGEILPGVPVAVLSDYEDPENIREAFDLGVRGYIPTSLAFLVAVGVVQLVCAGGTFAPTAALLAQGGDPRRSTSEPVVEGFTERQAQILDCLRRGMQNKLIAYELSMSESTVKVHVRNIMKKLNATNRTEVAYLTRGLFEGANHEQRA